MGKPKTCEIYVDASIRTLEAGKYVQKDGFPGVIHNTVIYAHRKCVDDPSPWAIAEHGETSCDHIKLSGCGIGIYFQGHPGIGTNFMVQTERHTISRMEMLAVRTALLLAYDRKKIIIYTDSQHCMMSLSTHMDGYVERNWLNVKGNVHIAESDIARQCVQIMNMRTAIGRKTEITKVNAHTGVNGNDIADGLAAAATIGTFHGIVTDNVVHSNGVAITTEITRQSILEAAEQIGVDFGTVLYSEDNPIVNNTAMTTRVYFDEELGIEMSTTRPDPDITAPNVEDHVSSVAVSDNVEPLDAAVVMASIDAENEAKRIAARGLRFFLVCVSCCDIVMITHRNSDVGQGIDAAIGLTYCRTCVTDDPDNRGSDVKLGSAIHQSCISPMLLRGSDTHRVIAKIAEIEPTILTAGRYVGHNSCRQVMSWLTRRDEIQGIDTDNSRLTSLRGGFF